MVVVVVAVAVAVSSYNQGIVANQHHFTETEPNTITEVI